METKLRNAAIFTFSAIGIGLGAWVNAKHQINHNGDTVMIAVAVFSAVMASVSGYGLLRAIRRWNIFEALIALIAFSVSSGYNLQNALGISASSRTEHVESRLAEGNTAERLQWQLGTFTTARTELVKLTNNKDAAVLRMELAGLRQDAAWTSTSGCTDATIPRSRTFCAGYKARQAQLAAAEKVEQLDARIDAINNRLTSLHAAPGQAADPQANVIGFALNIIGISGTEDRNIGKGLSLWFALLMWTFDSLGSVIGKLLFEPSGTAVPVSQNGKRKSAKQRKPEISAMPLAWKVQTSSEPSQPEPSSGNGKRKAETRKKATPAKPKEGNVIPFKRSRPSPSEIRDFLASGKTQAEAAGFFGYSTRQIRNIMKAGNQEKEAAAN